MKENCVPWILLILTLLAGGCGEDDGNVQVTGTLTDAGSPLQVSDRGDMQLHFIQLENGEMTGYSYTASVKPDGTYEIELPPSEYRVAAKQLDPYPDVDKLEGEFDEENSPITTTIEGAQELNIDLSEYES